RWLDQAEAEQAAMAVFEDRPYQPLVPTELQWRHWAQLKHRDEMVDRLRKLSQHLEAMRRQPVSAWPHIQQRLESLRDDPPAHPARAWLHMLAQPLRSVLHADLFNLQDLVRWVGELRIETPEERRQLLSVLDQLAIKLGVASEDEHS